MAATLAFSVLALMMIGARGIHLDVSNAASIREAASTIAHGAMSYYHGNTSGNPVMVGDLPDPYYWWQAGALWGAMLDYYHYTGDPTYNHVVLEALLAPANTGPKHDFNPPEHYLELGNDDLSFWGFAVLSAAERNFPQPKPELPSWLDMGQNIFRTLSSRWNTTHCGGGVLWQVFESNPNGLNYKNSVTNGGLFQLAARLARATGEATYTDWTTRAWDWSTATGLIGKKLNVYDGAHASDDCAQVNYVAFTYTAGIYLYGAAIMAEITGDQIWADRAHGILKAAGHFFGHSDASKDIMYEPACEPNDKCNHDMKSLKAYLSRFMWQSTHHLPSLAPEVKRLLQTSSLAAAQACSGGANGATCGQKWYVGGFDHSVGLGQQMCALETIQGLLIDETEAPFKAGGIKTVRDTTWPARPDRRQKPEEAPKGGTPNQDDSGAGGAAIPPATFQSGVILGVIELQPAASSPRTDSTVDSELRSDVRKADAVQVAREKEVAKEVTKEATDEDVKSGVGALVPSLWPGVLVGGVTAALIS